MAARSDAEHYDTELAREQREVVEVPDVEAAEVEQFFSQYDLQPAQVKAVIDAFGRSPRSWVEFMMRFELGLERPNPAQALKTAATTASALLPSIALTAVALFIFGFIKGRFTTGRSLRSARQTLLVGGLAAAAFGLARLIG